MPASSTSLKQPRPPWWTQEGVVGRLQDGAYIGELCVAASEEIAAEGYQCSPTKLRAEVSQWAESASWGERITAALKLIRKTPAGLTVSKDWYDEFFIAMEHCDAVAERAAAAAGIGYGLVLACLDRRNKKLYDADFAERFRVAESERVGRLRAKHFVDAEGDGKLAAGIRQKILETHAPSLHGPKQEVHFTGAVEIAHGITAELAEAVASASRDRMRVLSGAAERSLPASTGGQVIDVTRVRENAL